MILHNPARIMGGPVAFVRQEIATCGAKRIDGAEFTCIGRKVTCPACRAHVQARRAEARATFEAVLASMATEDAR